MEVNALLERYDQIRIINLRTRKDRRRAITSELHRLGLKEDPRVEFFDAIVADNSGRWRTVGEYGCYLSHLSVLKSAEEAGSTILILEDDCDFTDAAFESKWGLGSDIFYGGIGAADYSCLETSNIQGSHCMGFNRKVLTRLVAFLENLADGPSPPPIDGAYVEFRRSNPDLVIEFALPQVAVQRQSPSDIAPGRFDRNKLLRFAVGILRKLNRSRYRRRKMMDGL